MAPSPMQAKVDRFIAVVKSLGGRVLAEPCRSLDLPAIRAGVVPYQWATLGWEKPTVQAVETAYTCGCGGQTRAAVPYTGENGKAGTAVICAICDAGPRMPRFQEDPA